MIYQLSLPSYLFYLSVLTPSLSAAQFLFLYVISSLLFSSLLFSSLLWYSLLVCIFSTIILCIAQLLDVTVLSSHASSELYLLVAWQRRFGLCPHGCSSGTVDVQMFIMFIDLKKKK